MDAEKIINAMKASRDAEKSLDHFLSAIMSLKLCSERIDNKIRGVHLLILTAKYFRAKP